jgi:hypothetical protein
LHRGRPRHRCDGEWGEPTPDLHEKQKQLDAINGTSVTPEIALMVVNNMHVVDVNDGLFPTTSQTWRYIGF